MANLLKRSYKRKVRSYLKEHGVTHGKVNTVRVAEQLLKGQIELAQQLVSEEGLHLHTIGKWQMR